MRPLVAAVVAAMAVAFPAPAALSAAQAEWSVGTRPSLVIGAAIDDTSQMFSVVVGATRRPDGNILVADRGEWGLHLYAPDGRPIQRYGRKGSGPGEFSYLAYAYRCGDSLVAWDISGHRGSVFTLDGTFRRSTTGIWTPPDAGGQPYGRSACNRRGAFVHMGWVERPKDPPPVHRGSVPFWVGAFDASPGRVLGRFAGSERRSNIVEGVYRGSSPLPFGKESRTAIAGDAVYIGTADGPTVLVFGLDGRARPPITVRPGARTAVTRADIGAELERRIASSVPGRHAELRAEWRQTPFPAAFPPYRTLLVDAEQLLWVEDYPRAQAATTRWTVHSPDGRRVAELRLPRDLEVYEIGLDYVLGRYLDLDDGIPHVRMYRLTRNAQ